MAIKTYKATSPARRTYTTASFEEVTTNKPEKSLLATKKKFAGRNNQGTITVRRAGEVALYVLIAIFLFPP